MPPTTAIADQPRAIKKLLIDMACKYTIHVHVHVLYVLIHVQYVLIHVHVLAVAIV